MKVGACRDRIVAACGEVGLARLVISQDVPGGDQDFRATALLAGLDLPVRVLTSRYGRF